MFRCCCLPYQGFMIFSSTLQDGVNSAEFVSLAFDLSALGYFGMMGKISLMGISKVSLETLSWMADCCRNKMGKEKMFADICI